MGLRINNNTEAMNAYRNLNTTSNQMAKSLEKLSSGFRINRAADDAAGLSISEGLRSQISGFKVAVRNAQDGISLLQTAEGALNETTSLLQHIRDLTVQAANSGANDTASRTAISTEVGQSLAEIDRIANATVYGSKQLLDGTGGTFNFHVGYAGGTINAIGVAIGTMTSTALTLSAATVMASLLGTQAASLLVSIDRALTTVAAQRSQLGAYQNRLESTINNLSVGIENLSASESRIRDVDMAEEMTKFSKQQILQQAGTSMLAQANGLGQSVLTLLRG
jgi:flagellin